MARYPKMFKCEVLTPTGRAVGVDAVSVIIPMADGLLGVLADHAPLIGLVGAGPLTIEQPDGKVSSYYLAGGFAHFHENAMSILAEECVRVESLDVEGAKAELAQAQQLPADTAAARDRRNLAIAAAGAKYKLAETNMVAHGGAIPKK